MLSLVCQSCGTAAEAAEGAARCACGGLFTSAAQTEPRFASALRCSNCAGKVAPGARVCDYCACALAPASTAFGELCLQCGLRMELGSRHCRGCGAALEAQQSTGRALLCCPVCRAQLHTRSAAGLLLSECNACAGVWLANAVFSRLQSSAGRTLAPAVLPALPAQPAAPATQVEHKASFYRPCADCAALMQRRIHRLGARSSGVVFDVCKAHGLWLDRGELERVLSFTREQGAAASPVGGEFELQDKRSQPTHSRPNQSGNQSGPHSAGWGAGGEPPWQLLLSLLDRLL